MRACKIVPAVMFLSIQGEYILYARDEYYGKVLMNMLYIPEVNDELNNLFFGDEGDGD